MRSLLALIAAATLSTGASAESDKDHAAHHPPGASTPAAPALKAPMRSQIDMQTKAMQDMHEKMMAAKTPEERQALMAAHMKTMHDGMAMMGQMKGDMTKGSMGTSPDMMGKRMDMMETMMQMMLDREGMRPPATK